MATKPFASSVRGKLRAKSAKHMPENKLNLSDMPEATDEQLRRARRVGRCNTKCQAIDCHSHRPDFFLDSAAKQSKPYQTLIRELLERAAHKKVA